MTAETAGLLRFAFVWGGFRAFLVLELLAPYRPSTVSKPGRWATNLSLTAFNGLLMNLAFAAALLETTVYVTDHRVGVLALLDLPGSPPSFSTAWRAYQRGSSGCTGCSSRPGPCIEFITR